MPDARATSSSKMQIVWVCTRRGDPVADAVAGNLVGRYNLHDVLVKGAAPFQEFSKADLVVFEVPSSTRPHFERKMLEIVQKVRALGLEVMVVVQPSLRRKSNKSVWVSKWNFMSLAPFKLHQTCSCKTGDASGCHLTCFVGSSKAIFAEPCGEIPTLCATSQAAVDSFWWNNS